MTCGILSPKIKWRTQFKIWTCCTTQVFAFCNWLLRCCHFGRTIMQRILLRFLGCRMQVINVTFNIVWHILSSVFKILFSCRTKGDMILLIGLWVVTNDIICISFFIFTLRINKFFSVKFIDFLYSIFNEFIRVLLVSQFFFQFFQTWISLFFVTDYCICIYTIIIYYCICVYIYTLWLQIFIHQT